MEIYDGTDWRVVMTWDKDAENWEDLRFPVQGINPPGAATDPARDNSDGTLLFESGKTEVIAGIAQVPHGWDKETDISPHIHWCPTNTNTGNVVWRFEYEIENIGGTFTGYTSDDITVAADGTAEKHQIDSFTDITMTGFNESCIMKWKISRIGGDGADTYNADARLLEFDIHYQVGKLGTATEIPS